MHRSGTSRRHRTLQRNLALTAMVLGLVLLLAGGTFWLRTARQQHRTAELNRRIAAVNRQGFDAVDEQQLKDLAQSAEQLGVVLPGVTYALLHHRWQQAVLLFDGLRATLANPYLVDRGQSVAADLHAHLLQLRDAASESLADNQNLPLEWQWKIANLKGSTAVLLAYSVLYQEKDGRKAAKLLGDALEDYKIAIRQVDQVSRSSLERALPRWNMELIVAVGEYRRLGLTEIRSPDMARIQEQLETFIPEVPGFSPGAPLETRVEK